MERINLLAEALRELLRGEQAAVALCALGRVAGEMAGAADMHGPGPRHGQMMTRVFALYGGYALEGLMPQGPQAVAAQVVQ